MNETTIGTSYGTGIGTGTGIGVGMMLVVWWTNDAVSQLAVCDTVESTLGCFVGGLVGVILLENENECFAWVEDCLIYDWLLFESACCLHFLVM